MSRTFHRVYTCFGRMMLLAAIGGCVPINNKRGTDLTKIDQFTIEKGRTTEKELVEKLGPPSTTTNSGEGAKTLVWGGSNVKTNINFVSVLVPFAWLADPASKSEAETRSLVVQVRNGIVIDYSTTSSTQKY